MYEAQYLLVAAIGTISLVFAIGLYRWHNEPELFGAISLFSWVLIALGSGHLEVVEGGETHTFVSFPTQLFAAALAIISLFVIYGAIWGDWLDDSNTEDPI